MEAIFFWISLTFYLLFWAGFVFLIILRLTKFNYLMVPLFLAFLALTLTIGTRWFLAGHPPVFGNFENSLAANWFITLFILFSWKRNKYISLISVPIMVLIFANGLSFSREHVPLTISERSLWVELHVVFAWLAYSSYTVALGTALLHLLGRLPSREEKDDLMFKYVIYGFLMQSVTIASGSYYQFLVFGRWWRWDPVESVTLISWLIYALFIHLKLSFGWRIQESSYLVIFAYFFVIVSYWLLIFFPNGTTFHIFEIIGRVHIY